MDMTKILLNLMGVMVMVSCGIFLSGRNAYALELPAIENGQQKEQQDVAVRDCLPLFETGKSWKYKVSGVQHANKNEALEFYTVKEKCFSYGRDCWHITKTIDSSQEVVKNYYCYEDNGRIFWYDEGVPGWALIFDFNLNQGDNVLKTNCYVHSKDRICVAGIDRNRLSIGVEDSEGYWIEGIGAKGALYMTSLVVPGCPPADYTLLECSLKGKVLFAETDFYADTAGDADQSNICVDAPSYVPLFDTGKKWVYEKIEHDRSSGIDKISTFSVEVVGSDMIGEQECWRLHRTCIETGEEDDIFVREEAGRVSLYNPLTSGFALLMDFSYDKDYLVLEEVNVIDQSDKLKIEGSEMKRLRISLMKSKTVDYWVEGVGSRDFLFLTYVSDLSVKFRMLECSFDGKKLLGYDDFDRSTESVPLIEEDNDDGNGIYDISGRSVDCPQKGNVYIVGGRKVLY